MGLATDGLSFEIQTQVIIEEYAIILRRRVKHVFQSRAQLSEY